MLEIDQFKEILGYRKLGMNRSQCARGTGFDYGTVSRYWPMELEDYNAMVEEKRKRRGRGPKAAVYHAEIAELLREAPQRHTAQIIALLKERLDIDELEVSDRTIYQYVKWLRGEMFPDPKDGDDGARRYEAVPECAPGEQIQLDFGQVWLEKYNHKGRVSVYFAAYVLAHSRYKFVWLQDKPFVAEDVVNATQEAYHYFGGRAELLVIDQDSAMVVDENLGDIAYTKVFKEYIQKTGQRMWVCRGNDPESKGKVENVVKYVKGNFLEHRKFASVKELNQKARNWLRRTANAKVHSTTKKVPAEVFENVERNCLLPEPEYDFLDRTDIIVRNLDKSNVFQYKGNRYQVPFGTYSEAVNEVVVHARRGTLAVFTKGDEHIYTHEVVPGRGKLVQVPENLRRQRKDYQEEENRILEALGRHGTASRFLSAVREDKPRYVGDQLRAMLPHLGDWGERPGEVLDKMGLCLEMGEPSVPLLLKMLGAGGAPAGGRAAAAQAEGPSAPKRGLEAYAAIADAGKGAGNADPED